MTLLDAQPTRPQHLNTSTAPMHRPPGGATGQGGTAPGSSHLLSTRYVGRGHCLRKAAAREARAVGHHAPRAGRMLLPVARVSEAAAASSCANTACAHVLSHPNLRLQTHILPIFCELVNVDAWPPNGRGRCVDITHEQTPVSNGECPLHNATVKNV